MLEFETFNQYQNNKEFHYGIFVMLLFLCFLLQTLYKTQVKELKEEIEEKNKETLRKMQELQTEKYAHCVSQIDISIFFI